MDKHMQVTNILLVEDSPSLAAVYEGYLRQTDYKMIAVDTGAKALEVLEESVQDLVLLDLRLPDISGMELLKIIHERGLGCAVVIITAHGSIDLAIESMRFGASDFLTKPFDAARLRVTITNTLEKRRLTDIVTRYKNTFDRDHFHRFIGASLPMQAIFRIIESAGPSSATIFISGESGTGKELCAEAVHKESPRCKKAFVAINCAAIPRDLMESEVFGHVKGAFTGAVSNREGAAKQADGGTLFLDEVCEMNLELQSKLLRFIQTGRFQRVGADKEEQVDIRIVCATNRSPLEEVKAGRFREDLYYRLNVIPIQLPPLRDRVDDIGLIAGKLLQRISQDENKGFVRFSTEVEELFSSYSWPGNVRELENTIRNIVVLNSGEQVNLDMLPLGFSPNSHVGGDEVSEPKAPIESLVDVVSPSALSDIRALWLEERDVIERAILLCEGNIPKAAALLDISPSTIYRKRLSWESANEEKAEGR
ncbi:MAG: two-component system repressor protein LuxO [Gammaproteobacteria bacterium]|jgi:two-component system repressor protein LuxO